MKPEREGGIENSKTNDAAAYAANWWIFGKATSRTSSGALRAAAIHRDGRDDRSIGFFNFWTATFLPDNMLVAIVR